MRLVSRLLNVALCLVGIGATPVLAQGPVAEYVVRDTSEYQNLITRGRLGLLYRNGTYVDSIDLGFGLLHVPGAVVYQPVRVYDEDPYAGKLADVTEVVYYDGACRQRLSDVLPLFDDYFSSAAAIDSVLYYWGILFTPEVDHWAVRYDFRTASADSTFLFQKNYFTDTKYLSKPRKEDNLLVFEAPDTVFFLDEGLHIVERRSPKP